MNYLEIFVKIDLLLYEFDFDALFLLSSSKYDNVNNKKKKQLCEYNRDVLFEYGPIIKLVIELSLLF